MLLQGNSLKIPIGDKLVQCVVTSPPYYGLRDYGINGQLGLELTLQEYIDNTVLWAREVGRVLRDDGTFWLNIGDSYNSTSGFSRANEQWARKGRDGGANDKTETREMGLKTKDLMMVPHRVAIALQEDGWWVRSDIVWHKPNPMPESVTDRPTKSHEYIFLLTKNKTYYFDNDAIREDKAPVTVQDPRGNESGKRRDRQFPGSPSMGGTNLGGPTGGRNKRTVWTITTKPYPGAHFATFAPEIPEICIKAGTSEKGVCPVCGNGWAREVERGEKQSIDGARRNPPKVTCEADRLVAGIEKWNRKTPMENSMYYPRTTVGWKPTCDHNEEPVPAIVLDPFAGSGTTVMVANALGRRGIGIDLSWSYLQLARERTGAKALEEWVNGKKAESNLEGLPMFDS
jgi:DNA modification methylase